MSSTFGASRTGLPNLIGRVLLGVVLFVVWPVAAGLSQEPQAGLPAHPVRVSDNGRHFVDRNGVPVFWLGTTQWQLFRGYTLEDAKTILEKTRERGFVFAQVMLLGVGDPTGPNVYGERPWIDDNPLTPNEAYFRHVDAVVRIAEENNVAISMTVFHQRYRNHITVQNAYTWARWVAERYKDVPTLVWSMTPEAKAEFVPILRRLAAGLKDGDGGCHLITFKPDPAPFSSSFVHGEQWLHFNSMQTWNRIELIYPFVTRDYGLSPPIPVLMAEGAYEAGSEYGFEITPLWIRRQAFYSYLAGGHHTYGHNDSWRVLPTWKQALDAPGAVQLGVLKKILTEREEWWHLVPDQTLFVAGARATGKVLNLAARHKDGRWAVAYLGGRSLVFVRMSVIKGGNTVVAHWVDPRTGQSLAAGRFSNTSVEAFSIPDRWEDAVLILEPSSE